MGARVTVSDKDKDEDGEEEACTEESAGDKPVALRNAAFFIDRKGDVVGEYWKRCARGRWGGELHLYDWGTCV